MVVCWSQVIFQFGNILMSPTGSLSWSLCGFGHSMAHTNLGPELFSGNNLTSKDLFLHDLYPIEKKSRISSNTGEKSKILTYWKRSFLEF
jgi:hypothetical protein